MIFAAQSPPERISRQPERAFARAQRRRARFPLYSVVPIGRRGPSNCV